MKKTRDPSPSQELNVKARYWTFDFYDSCLEKHPEFESMDELLQHLASDGSCFEVAYHDKEEKKPHYHLIAAYPGPITRRAMYFKWGIVLDNRANAANVQPIGSFSGMCRYMLHLDDPEKHTYTKECLKDFNGFTPDYIPASGDDKKKARTRSCGGT